MPETAPPPLFIKLTHLCGLPVSARAEPLPLEGMIIGRDYINNLAGTMAQKRDPWVAEGHVRLFPGEVFWRAKAVSKELLTVINDEVIAPEATVAISPGDVLEIGFARLAFTEKESSAGDMPAYAEHTDLPAPERELSPAPERLFEYGFEDNEAALDAWHEVASSGQEILEDDILRQLGREGLRVLNNPEMLNLAEWGASEHYGPAEKNAGREAQKNLWQMCGNSEAEGKSLADCILGEISIDDVLNSLGRAEPEFMNEDPLEEDPLVLLGSISAAGYSVSRQTGAAESGRGLRGAAPGGKKSRARTLTSIPAEAVGHGVTLDSHYSPVEARSEKNRRNKQ